MANLWLNRKDFFFFLLRFLKYVRLKKQKLVGFLVYEDAV